MQKYKKKIGLGITLLALSVFLIFPNNVEAKKSTNGNNGTTEATNACSNALFNGTMLDTSQDSINYYVTVYAKNGLWNIKYYYGDVDDFDYTNIFDTSAISPKGTFEYKGGQSQKITIPKLDNEQQTLVVIAELKGTVGDSKTPPQGYSNDGKILKVDYKEGKTTKTTTCRTGTVGISGSKFTITGTGAVITKTIKAKTTKTLRNLDAEEQAECTAMQQGKYNTDLSNNSNDLEGTDLTAYNEQMQKSFPYCYGTGFSATYDLTAKTIKKVRQESLKAYKQYIEFIANQQDNSKYEEAKKEIQNENYKKLAYSSKGMNIEKLSCDKAQTTEKTEKYYTETTDVDNNACKITCQEQIQITYDPPVATKAGLCFQYKVTVKSKVTCKTESKANIVWPTPPQSCSYTPICSDNEQETQAGPNEKFDSCINECDGGKYSQSCINSCYKKVYENNKTTTEQTSIQNNSNNIVKLAKTKSDPYYRDSKCDTNSEIQKNLNYCNDYFYKLKQKYPMGYYKKATSPNPSWIDYLWQPCWKNSNSNCTLYDDNDKQITYTVDPTEWNKKTENIIESIKRSSPYYFRTKSVAKKTIQSFYGEANGTNGFGAARKYNIDDGGIKRQYSESYQCDETCGFVKDENGNDCKDSDKKVREYYVDAFDNIASILSKCTASAVCKEDTSTFDMSVDNTVMKDKNKQDESKWEATNKTNNDSKTCYSPSGDIEMFIPLVTDKETGTADSECSINPNGINGKCYGKNNATYWQHYKTTITFPGTWVDLKTGKRVYQKEEYNKDTMKEKPNYYCVGFDYEPINEQWWDWKINQNADLSKISGVKVEDDDNITASISDFGKYNWNINLNCFYALSSSICEGEECIPIKDECNNENSTALCNIDFRPTNQQNLFPSADGTGSRAAGFNWTSAATDKSPTVVGTSYGIDPGEYAQKLQQEAVTNADVAYSGTADYSVHLTKDNIKNLRSYVKENGYTSYRGNNKNTPVEKVDGLYYYTSDIIKDGSIYVSQFSRTATLGKNND